MKTNLKMIHLKGRKIINQFKMWMIKINNSLLIKFCYQAQKALSPCG